MDEAGTSGLDASAEAALEQHVALSLQLHALLSTASSTSPSAGLIDEIKALLNAGAAAWIQDDDGWSALHHAAEANVNEKVVEFLLRNGAVWNLVDNLGFTAADIAYSLNNQAIYQLIVMEGVRSELLKAVLEGDAEDSMSEDDATSADSKPGAEPKSTASDNKAFLASKLTFDAHPETGEERCIDSEGNGVMMGWEAPIMTETARLLCAADQSDEEGFAVLNVGFGLGIVDSEIQNFGKGKVTRHVIIEPHPDVLEHARSKGWYEKPGVEIFEGTWQDFLTAFHAGEQQAEFDGIYFDTFSEHYKDLHAFFDALPDLLRGPGSVFSFFHGLGATSVSFYEVYTQVSECHLRDIGLKTDWYEVSMLDEGERTWDGVTRRYWNIPCAYRLPMCTLDY